MKNTQVVERIQNLTDWVFDKTGTLNENHPELEYFGDALTEHQKLMIYSLCSRSMHPESRALARHLKADRELAPEDFEEIPGKGIKGRIAEDHILIGSPAFVKGQGDIDEKGIWVAINGKSLGYYKSLKKPREGINEMLKRWRLKMQGHQFHLLSGDHDTERPVMQDLLGTDACLKFRQSPEDKLRYIKELQKENKKVAMMGDGLNDAGALKQSEVGIVLTEDVNNFTPASDVIIHARVLADFDRFLRFIHNSQWVLYLAYGVAFCYNVIGLAFALQGKLSPVLAAIIMPLSSVTIVAIGLGAVYLYYRSFQFKEN